MTPAIQVYAEASGYRTIIRSPHNSGSSGSGRATSTAVTPHDYEVSLESYCNCQSREYGGKLRMTMASLIGKAASAKLRNYA